MSEAIRPVLGAVAFFVQGRWWCDQCRVMWAGTWNQRDVAPHLPDGEAWAPVHDCGVVMARTSGDERGATNEVG